MKKLILTSVALLMLNLVTANAQSTSDMVKTKVDSTKKAAINSAINDPVNTVGKVFSIFGRKPKNQDQTAQASTTNNTSTGNNYSNNNAQQNNSAPNNGPQNNVYTNTGSAGNGVISNNAGMITGNSKIINNGLVFSIVQCTGDRASQTISITYTLSNPSKPNQAVIVGALATYANGGEGGAIDANGNSLKIGSITMANKTDLKVVTELPTGILIRGNINLINALPNSSNLQVFKIAVASFDNQGGGNHLGGYVEERNIPVTWLN